MLQALRCGVRSSSSHRIITRRSVAVLVLRRLTTSPTPIFSSSFSALSDPRTSFPPSSSTRVSRMSSASSAAAQESMGPVERTVHDKLTAAFSPQHIEVINESETHFKVIVVSASFDGQTLITRHRSVHTALADELKSGVHALSVTARTPQQWQQSGGTVSKSPACMGGMKAESEAAAARSAANTGSSSGQ